MKTRNIISFVIVVTGMLVGCNSFNHIQLPEESFRKLANQKGTELTPKEYREFISNERDVLPPTTISCPLYKPPAVQPMPELPLRELAALSRDDTVAMDRIQQQHISDLRLYISSMIAAQRKANKDYLKSCGLDVPPK